jgi:hypothetical protein
MSPLGNRAHGCGKPWGGTGRVGAGELIQAGLVGSGLGDHALLLYGAKRGDESDVASSLATRIFKIQQELLCSRHVYEDSPSGTLKNEPHTPPTPATHGPFSNYLEQRIGLG